MKGRLQHTLYSRLFRHSAYILNFPPRSQFGPLALKHETGRWLRLSQARLIVLISKSAPATPSITSPPTAATAIGNARLRLCTYSSRLQFTVMYTVIGSDG